LRQSLLSEGEKNKSLSRVFGRIPAEVLSKDKDFGGTKPLLCRRLEQHKGGEMKRRLIAVASITVLICVVLGNIVACTPPTEYALFINSTEGGSVTTPGEGMFTCDEGAVVNLVATPDAGYKFVNWTSNVGTIADVNNATTTITMNGDYSITANFEPINTGSPSDGEPLVYTGCFIATAAYGTPTAEQIDVLREFRDVVLLESAAGSQFVSLYYQLSPPVADFIAGNELLRTLVRELLVDPIVWIVKATGDIWRN